MGFRQGSYMSCWSVEPNDAGTTTRVRLSSSRKNKVSGEYEQDFSGFCTFIGKANEMAAGLQERDRIKILECDVTTNYNKEKGREYVNYKVFDFVMADGSTPTTDKPAKVSPKKQAPLAEEGEVEEDDLPF